MSAENIVFKAVDKITSAREASGSYRGNSHHLSQEISTAVVAALRKEGLIVKDDEEPEGWKTEPFGPDHEILRKFPSINCNGWSPWVAKIPTKAGRVVAWRNGGDRGDYNFLIYVEATKEFHPRPNVKDVVDLIEMIASPKDGVLFVGQRLGKRNAAYLERILK